MQATLRAAVHLPEGSISARNTLREASGANAELFFQAGMRLMESVTDTPECSKVYSGLLGCPAFLIELTRKERFGRDKLLQFCRDFLAIDKRLDIRLANLLPGRSEDRHKLEPEVTARILDILNEISVGPRLVLLLNHLTNHHNAEIAEKATILMGRRLCNPAWVQKRLESGGPEVRAGAVEGLWGRNTPEARLTMRLCLNDSNERVVGNAVFGLHLLSEGDTLEQIDRLIEDDRPAFRATAAWLAGQIDQPQCAGVLQRAWNDTEACVRLAAKQAMVKARRMAELANRRQVAALPEGPPPAPSEGPKPATLGRPHDFDEELGETFATRWDLT